MCEIVSVHQCVGMYTCEGVLSACVLVFVRSYPRWSLWLYL